MLGRRYFSSNPQDSLGKAKHAHCRHAVGRVLIAGHLRQFHPNVNGVIIGATPSLPRNFVSFPDPV